MLAVVAAVLLIALPVSFFILPVNAEPEIEVSARTTWVTKPVRKDGNVDHVAAVNARLSKGVTPENNAAVLLAQAIGPKVSERSIRKEFFAKLGIPVPPSRGEYFRTMRDFAEHTAPAKADAYYDELSKQQETGETKPWSRQQHQKLAAWIDDNEKPLKLVLRAVQRERYYVPIVAGKDENHAGVELFTMTGLEVDHVREISRALKCRAMLAVHEGRINDAQRDLVASHKLARLTTQGFSTMELMVGCALDSLTDEADVALLRSGKLSKDQLQRFQRALSNLPDFPTPADKINFSERLSRLQVVTYIARHGYKGLEPFVDTKGFDNPLTRRILERHLACVDWNYVLMRMNREFDQLHSALNRPRYSDRERAIARYHEQSSKAGNLKEVVAAGFLNRQRGTKMTAELLISELMFTAGNSRLTHDRATTKHRLIIIAIALERFRQDSGRFPAKLADLRPRFLKNLPQDLFTEKQFRYVPEATGYVLYSVGPNRTDDGGNELGAGNADDIAVKVSIP
jgi:hypothetical protein